MRTSVQIPTREPTRSGTPPLHYGSDIKPCLECGCNASPDELVEGLCDDCAPVDGEHGGSALAEALHPEPIAEELGRLIYGNAGWRKREGLIAVDLEGDLVLEADLESDLILD